MILWTVALQFPLSMEFSRQEYWSGLLFPSPGESSQPETKPMSPALQEDSLPSEPPGKPLLQERLPNDIGKYPSHVIWSLSLRNLSIRVYYSGDCDFAAAAAKSLQSCPTLCDPRDGSPPGSPAPGILQARTLEWVAISFSNA